MTIIEKIKAEIERRIKILREDDVVRQNCTPDFLEGKIHGYETLLSFLSTLESEHLADACKTSSNDLKEAAARFSKNVSDGHNYRDLRVGFIVGAKWDREQMLKEAVDTIVEDWNPDPEPEITIPLNPEEFTCGDKVRVIVCKKED